MQLQAFGKNGQTVSQMWHNKGIWWSCWTIVNVHGSSAYDLVRGATFTTASLLVSVDTYSRPASVPKGPYTQVAQTQSPTHHNLKRQAEVRQTIPIGQLAEWTRGAGVLSARTAFVELCQHARHEYRLRDRSIPIERFASTVPKHPKKGYAMARKPVLP